MLHVTRLAPPGHLPLKALRCSLGNLVALEAKQHHIMAANELKVQSDLSSPQLCNHDALMPELARSLATWHS